MTSTDQWTETSTPLTRITRVSLSILTGVGISIVFGIRIAGNVLQAEPAAQLRSPKDFLHGSLAFHPSNACSYPVDQTFDFMSSLVGLVILTKAGLAQFFAQG